MALKSATYQFKGMNRDLSNMNASKDYAYEIRNMKITANKDNTLFSISSVKGPLSTRISLKGTPIGHCTINDQWVIFTKGTIGWSEAPDINIQEDTNTELEYRVQSSEEIQVPTYDYIYLISNDNNNIQEKHVCGNLNFSIENPIEAIPFVENEEIKKIYWTDGLNQPRFITTKAILEYDEIKSSDVDFIPEIKNSNNEKVTISKNENTIGMFPAGTTQYAFSYINYYGQQSNIFHISSVYYNVSNDKALEVNKTSSDSYKITIYNLNNTDYQYVRIYSIVRTSQDSTPEVRVVTDYKLEDNKLEYTDRHTTGYTIDPTELFYIGGEQLIVGTMTQKDNTLFIGDITQKKEVLPDDIVQLFNGIAVEFKFDNNKYITEHAGDKYYADQFRIKNTPSKGITTFKTGEYYRFGVQLMHKSGRWSEPIYIGDYQNNTKIYSTFNLDSKGNKTSHYHKLISAEAIINEEPLLQYIKNLGYVKIRPVIVYPEFADRSILCQGYLSPTVYNVKERDTANGIYAQSSWFARPFLNEKYDCAPTRKVRQELQEENYGSIIEFRHNAVVGSKDCAHSEFQNMDYISYKADDVEDPEELSFCCNPSYYDSYMANHSSYYFVDNSIVTFHSPEIEFDNTIKNIDLNNYKCRIIGYVPLTSHQGNIDVITSKGPENDYKNSDNFQTIKGFTDHKHVGFYNSRLGNIKNFSKYGNRILCSGVFYRDSFINNYDSSGNNYVNYYDAHIFRPWSDEIADQIDPNINFTAKVNKKERTYYYSPFKIYSGNTVDLPLQTNQVDDYQINLKDKLISTIGFHIYPFHTSGSISGNEFNELQYKKLSNVRYSYGSVYFSDSDIKNFETTSISLYNTENNELLRIKDYKGDQVLYQGNVDTILTPTYIENGTSVPGTKIKYDSQIAAMMYADTDNNNPQGIAGLNKEYADKILPMYKEHENKSYGYIRVRYKSTPHIVLSLKGDSTLQRYLPCLMENGKVINNTPTGTSSTWKPFWQASTSNYINDFQSIGTYDKSKFEYSGLWLAEFYQNIDKDVIFGGKSTQAIANNKWNIAGEEVLLNTNSVTLNYTEGDTYYQRYDNLKTYPWSMEEVNGITDVISFMVETRINLEGRYDSNKADKPHFHILPSNFNLINKAYTQKNNFFEYYGVDYDKIEVNKYPNLISWSKTKTAGELTDTWLNLNLSSTLDLDGNCGKITSLQNYNGQIFAFQEKAINQILYNEQTQISTSAGVPIEIANSGKVTGYRNYSNQVGCSNKWSICQTPNGLYFLDSLNKDLYKIGESLSNLSSTNGFNTYLRSIPNIEKPWSPAYNNSIKTSYDPINKEVLFSTDKETLSYSEQLQSFMSFYDFKAEYISTLNGNTFILGKTELKNDIPTTAVYKYQEGMYNYQYEKQVPYYVEFIANPEPLNDKIFNVLEFRSDSWDNHNYITHNNTFNKLTISNEYQNVSKDLVPNENLKKRFRIWKAQIPREPRNGSPLQNRIRNTWAKIKLESTENNENLNTVLHDITVHYSV